MTYSDLGISAFALYAIVRAAFVSIPGEYPVPEFSGAYAIVALTLILALAVISLRRRPKQVRLKICGVN
jgi:hypothetical protein